jgi:hypothetical protein
MRPPNQYVNLEGVRDREKLESLQIHEGKLLPAKNEAQPAAVVRYH